VGVLVLLLIGTWVQYGRVRRPTVPRVAGMASVAVDARPAAALARTVDGMGFPAWRDSGFHAIGGGTFVISGRPAATVAYARGEERIGYTIVSGTRHINYADSTLTQYGRVAGRQRELNWLDSELVVTFKRAGRTVVMTGTPATSRLRRDMKRLALARP
jgi:hypothetical protein